MKYNLEAEKTMPENTNLNRNKPIPVNPALVWDYDIPEEQEQTEEFRRWYLARVLMRGSSDDLRSIGFEAIYAYLPELNLSKTVRRFWEWYFNLPDVQKRHELTHHLPREAR
jgi:hypothetical protein